MSTFSESIGGLNMMPLWERTGPLRPGSRAVPAHWHYADVRAHLLRAAELISQREAERRVLVLENPALRGTTFITQTLYAGLQIILPGEIAPSHRHSPAALRFVVEGEGAYTNVGGAQLAMRPGDLIVTPSWAWHDHGNLGSGPVVWLDGLDTPFTRFFGATFTEEDPQEKQPANRTADASLPFPYSRFSDVLRRAPRDEAHGARLRYPTGFTTMATFLQRLPARFAGRGYRSTDGNVFCVVEGRGRVSIGEQDFAFSPHDVFVVPPWQPCRLNAETECVLFRYSDRAAQEALGLWREELL